MADDGRDFEHFGSRAVTLVEIIARDLGWLD